MRRLPVCAALCAAASLLLPPALQAQMSFGVSGGLSLPVGNTADAVNSGYNVTLSAQIKPPLAPIGFRADGMFNSMEFKGTEGTHQILALTANATLSGVASPIPLGYLIGGVGMYNGRATGLPAGATSESNTDVGFNIGAGLNFPLTGFNTFLEARLHFIMTEGESTKFVPITFGIMF